MKRINFCNSCKNIWSYYDDLHYLRLDDGKKARIISKECPKCKLFNGNIEIEKLFAYIRENKWEIKDHSDYLCKIIFNEDPLHFYIFPKIITYDFTHRISQFILNVSIAKKQLKEDIEKELFNL
jgi:hypothetical protein